MTSLDIAIVLVQDSFQIPFVYQKLTSGLENHGYSTSHPHLPSCSNTTTADFPSKTLDDDTDAVKSVLERLVNDEGKKVVVVMHSYGGLVGSNAVSKELRFSHRKATGLPGGVIHLFYFAAFMLDEGQSVLSAFGESPNNDVKVSAVNSINPLRPAYESTQADGRMYLKDGAALLYNDLPAQEAAEWEERLIAQSHAVQRTEITCAAWKYVPSTYLLCENDKAAPPQYQQMFAELAGSKLIRYGAGHSPMLSQPGMLVKSIVEAVVRAVVG
jgi:pimeloyl-ACP methyl ester carboxylesterase